MARMRTLNTTSGGSFLIPEGTHVFKVMSCEDKYDDFDKVSYELHTADGKKTWLSYNFVVKGEVNEIATWYWSKFVNACLNSDGEVDVDFSEVVGCYVSAEIVHEKYTNTNGEEKTKAKIVEKTLQFANGFGSTVEKEDDDGFRDITNDELDELDL